MAKKPVPPTKAENKSLLLPRRPEKTPPGRLARFFGSRDPDGAEAAIVNLLVDLSPTELSPAVVHAVCAEYGLTTQQREQVIYTIFRATVAHHMKRDVLTEEGVALIPQVGEALGVPDDEWDTIVRSVARSRKRDREKKARPREADAPQAAAGGSTVQCPKCGSQQIAGGAKGFGVGKAAAGLALLGPIGLLGGAIGSKDVIASCLACGHQWSPRKRNVES